MAHKLNHHTLPILSIGALGGTVSMRATQSGTGATPALTGEALLEGISQLHEGLDVRVDTLCLIPSASLDFNLMLEVLIWAQEQVKLGVQGVVITQGTDTLEETAFFLDLLWNIDVSLVLTGAMRPSDRPSADGPANLLDAARVALDTQSRKRGVLVVMNEQIHQALHVRKTSSMALEAFSSPLFGPVGLMIENRVCYLRKTGARTVLPMPRSIHHRVALLPTTLAADTVLLEHILALGYDALVVSAFGGGHVSVDWVDLIDQITTEIPVLVASRTGSGPTAEACYGFIGSEMDLIDRGAVMCGFLCPYKARILIWLLIGAGMGREVAKHVQRLGFKAAEA
ncbi:asparaginase [Pseudomonas fragi]|uniref:asparaginase n=1 Tax=Pseudomonas fragi TaxID=296 RepID=UPI00031B9F8C|nr:asparaginase [Pseudomonas fragi]MDE4513067.1 asparaginase [Pseudomonas fragi]QPC35013.1 asparaginase [Pseudomonas fragi]SDU60421.1 asparaginase [Pseudomonas fragi]